MRRLTSAIILSFCAALFFISCQKSSPVTATPQNPTQEPNGGFHSPPGSNDKGNDSGNGTNDDTQQGGNPPPTTTPTPPPSFKNEKEFFICSNSRVEWGDTSSKWDNILFGTFQMSPRLHSGSLAPVNEKKEKITDIRDLVFNQQANGTDLYVTAGPTQLSTGREKLILWSFSLDENFQFRPNTTGKILAQLDVQSKIFLTSHWAFWVDAQRKTWSRMDLTKADLGWVPWPSVAGNDKDYMNFDQVMVHPNGRQLYLFVNLPGPSSSTITQVTRYTLDANNTKLVKQQVVLQGRLQSMQWVNNQLMASTQTSDSRFWLYHLDLDSALTPMELPAPGVWAIHWSSDAQFYRLALADEVYTENQQKMNVQQGHINILKSENLRTWKSIKKVTYDPSMLQIQLDVQYQMAQKLLWSQDGRVLLFGTGIYGTYRLHQDSQYQSFEGLFAPNPKDRCFNLTGAQE